MEKLKPLEEVCQPDVRYRNRVDLDHSTGTINEATIESIYRVIEPIQLRANVPEEVRSHFEIARNLRIEGSWWHWLGIENQKHGVQRRRGPKGGPAGQQLI